MAPLASFEPLVRGMLPNSGFLEMLDAALPLDEAELICYARLQDELVGTDRCAPEGHPLHWVPNRRFQRAHRRSRDDVRLLADIARRIRGETPFSTEPGTPPPPGPRRAPAEIGPSGSVPDAPVDALPSAP